MSDVFISYASIDRERAKVFADALAEKGWSVWWDRNIPAGRQFDEVIEEALDAAKCVVVLWSQASAASTWVKTEAAEAMRGKTLIPAIIEEGVRIPLEFRRLQAADLSRWTGDRDDPQLQQFFQSIEGVLKRPRPAPVITPTDPAPDVPRRAEPVQPSDPLPPLSPRLPPARKLTPIIIGVVAAVAAVLAGLAYYQAQGERAERRKAEQALAERTQAEQARDERMKAEERTKAEQARADRDRAEVDRVARDERERANRAEQERKAKSQPPVAAARQDAPAQQGGSRGVPASGVMPLQWRDHALGYSGSLTWNPSSALLQVGVVDLRTGTRIGNYSVAAMVQQQGPMEYVVSAQFAVPGDSTTAGPHTHTSRLLLQAQQDGSLRFLQNCPRAGECY